ncbi:uncharacterized protein LOC124153494 [Ischnura elegans]|uniref:uncharacterized protein LOC124153494 n=1 Tax=Ischnura elegans TaxID=197161 RepID=UPI001ED87B56|nr:uncharacterized protein LOC124153494 [Ischnura elegans]
MNSMLQKVSAVVGVGGVGDVFSKAAVSVAVPKMTAVAGTNRIYAGVGNGVSHQFGSLQHLHGGEAAMVQFLLGGDHDGATGDSLVGVDTNNNGNEVTVVLSTVQDTVMREPVAATTRELATGPSEPAKEEDPKPFPVPSDAPAAEPQPPVEEGRRTRGASEKYSLRPRSIQNRMETELRRRGGRTATSSVEKSARSGGSAAAAASEAREGATVTAAGSGGRSGSGGGRREPKPKQKPPPLSKYRRKTANARERSRMREINQAFETLRKAVPTFPAPLSCSSSSSSSSCSSSSGSPSYGGTNKASEKLTKITTLRLAMNYIEALAQILREKPREEDASLLSPSSTTSSTSSLSSASSSPYLHQNLHHHHHPYRQDAQPHPGIHQQAPLPSLIQLPSLLPPMPPLPLGTHLGGFTSHQLAGSAFGDASSGCGSDELGDYATTCSDLLSDDGSTFGGGGCRGGGVGDPLNVDPFEDIIGDGLDILLESDGESLQFHSDLSEQSTP